MPLHRAPLWLLWAVLGSFVPGSRCGSPRHSLCYSYLKVSESSQGLPQLLSMVHLDDQPIARYDSPTRRMVPVVPWMEAEEVKTPERMFRADLEQLSNFNHQTGGLHTWQVVLGCELREDGRKGGFLHYGYDGRDFISFDKKTLRWVAAQPQAQKVKEKWEEDPGWSEKVKVFLEDTCIEWLQRYLSHLNETVQRTEPLVGKVTHKAISDSVEVLICQAFGFYPKEIQATWTRDGEICQYETIPRNVAPNSDGTYYVWLSIDIDPKERDHFQCHLDHKGLEEPLVLAWKEETGRWRRFRKNLSPQTKSCLDHTPSQMAAFPPVYGTEDEIQSQPMLQPKVIVEHEASYRLWEAQSALKTTLSTLPRQKQKQQRLKRCRSWAGELEIPLETPAEAGAAESGVRIISQSAESPGSLFQCPEVSEGFTTGRAGSAVS